MLPLKILLMVMPSFISQERMAPIPYTSTAVALSSPIVTHPHGKTIENPNHQRSAGVSQTKNSIAFIFHIWYLQFSSTFDHRIHALHLMYQPTREGQTNRALSRISSIERPPHSNTGSKDGSRNNNNSVAWMLWWQGGEKICLVWGGSESNVDNDGAINMEYMNSGQTPRIYLSSTQYICQQTITSIERLGKMKYIKKQSEKNKQINRIQKCF